MQNLEGEAADWSSVRVGVGGGDVCHMGLPWRLAEGEGDADAVLAEGGDGGEGGRRRGRGRAEGVAQTAQRIKAAAGAYGRCRGRPSIQIQQVLHTLVGC